MESCQSTSTESFDVVRLFCKQGFINPVSNFTTYAPIRIETSATILSDSAKPIAREVMDGKRDVQVRVTLQILLNPKS
jgi:hypothetical protein